MAYLFMLDLQSALTFAEFRGCQGLFSQAFVLGRLEWELLQRQSKCPSARQVLQAFVASDFAVLPSHSKWVGTVPKTRGTDGAPPVLDTGQRGGLRVSGLCFIVN